MKIALFFILGALWRRWFGGWPAYDVPRWFKLLVATALGFFALWPVVTWEVAFPLSIFLVLFWVPGHQLSGWSIWRWLLRYGPLGIYWWVADRLGPRWKHRWNWGPFDGTISVAELLAGGTFYAVLAWVALL